jgi:hypothetical protein
MELQTNSILFGSPAKNHKIGDGDRCNIEKYMKDLLIFFVTKNI